MCERHLPPLDLRPAERSGARGTIAPRNAMGDNVTIQKNWQELIKPNKLQVSAGGDARSARPPWSPSRSSAASA